MTRAERKVLDLIEDSDLTLCVLWPITTGQRYGSTRENGRLGLVHRIAFRVWNGGLPEGCHVHHECEVPACVNPLHLRTLSPREHTLIGAGPSAVNARKTHCHRGHALTPENTYRPRSGSRMCRICNRASALAYYHRRARS